LQKTIKADFDLPFYGRRHLTLVRGEGARLWDDVGREYIDCVAGMGVAGLGHAHPAVTAAIAQQAGTLVTCPNLFWHAPGLALMQRLVEVTPEGLNRVFFCNSGAEAMEAAIKLARLSTGKTDFIAAEGAFHGRTLGALSATHRQKYRKPFAPLVPGFCHVPFNDFEALASAVTDQTAGILLEVIQGEGGIIPANDDYLRAVRALCDDKGIVLVFDEVQSGFCRTGRWFACEHAGVVPDILAVAKALAGGLPMGAVVCSDRIQAEPGLHGTTFGGNPLCAAAGVAAIDAMQSEQLADRAMRLGDAFVAALRARSLPGITEIRHRGLMIGVELNRPVAPVIAAFQEHGVLVFGAGETVIRLLPPLVIEEEALNTVLETFSIVLTK